MQKDVCREGLTREKVKSLGRLFVPALNHAIAKVSSFSVLDICKINDLLGTNFQGIILDIDECVAPHHGEILPENVEAIINMIRQGIRLVIFSNMKAGERYEPLIRSVRESVDYEIKVIMSPHPKPDPRGFAECVESLELSDAEDALMIGDNFLTDGGCTSAGIAFARVEPVKTHDETNFQKFKRSFQRSIRSFYASISDANDFIYGRKVLRDEDFALVQ